MSDRRAMIAKIHVAKKQLGLDDGAYRAVLVRVTDRDSSAACSDAQLEQLIKEFVRLGFRNTGHAKSNKPWVRKVYAIWADLRPLLDDATDTVLHSFIARQTRSLRNPAGISRPEWLTAEDATPVIQGLQGWLNRARTKAHS
jgi:hypothetical protein